MKAKQHNIACKTCCGRTEQPTDIATYRAAIAAKKSEIRLFYTKSIKPMSILTFINKVSSCVDFSHYLKVNCCCFSWRSLRLSVIDEFQLSLIQLFRNVGMRAPQKGDLDQQIKLILPLFGIMVNKLQPPFLCHCLNLMNYRTSQNFKVWII